ncbi:hypothetical protein ACMFMF_006975 [Clarireedia jacksonii]
MLLTMHYNRIALLLILILFSLLTVLHHIRPHSKVHLPNNVHNVLSYFSGPGRADRNVISGRKISQSQVLELGARRGFVDMGREGGGQEGTGKDGAKGGEKIPRILHQIWINYGGGFEHVLEGSKRMEKEKEKDKDKDKVDKGKVSKKESRGKPKNEGKWDVTGGEGLEHVPQELEERRRTCKVVNRGWKVYVRSLSHFTYPITSFSHSLIIPLYYPNLLASQQPFNIPL